MKNKIKGSCEFSDVTTIELNDVFPNPTEVQINEWNKWFLTSQKGGDSGYMGS